MFINEEACADQVKSVTIGYDEDHIIVDCIDKYEMKESYAQGQWKHAKICLSLESKDATVKESGIYIVRDERTNMEIIQFTNPFHYSDLLTKDQGIVLSHSF